MAFLNYLSLYLLNSMLIMLGIVILSSAITVGPLIYLHRVIIAIDQFGTALIGGYPGETMSSYAYRLDRQGKIGGRIFRPAIDALFFWQHLHCRDSYLGMLARLNLPPELRV